MAVVCASSARRPNSCCTALTCCSASRRLRRRLRVTWPRRLVTLRWARFRAVAPRRSTLRRFFVARRRSLEASRRMPVCVRRGLTLSTTFSPPLTAAPTAVSATRCACQPIDFSRLCCARARVSAAFRAERLRLAAFCLRVAAARCAAALRCVSVCVAIGIAPFLRGCLHRGSPTQGDFRENGT